MKKYIGTFVLTFLLSVASVSAFQTSSSELLDFGSWDHSQIVSDGGQDFVGICGDIGVNVTADGIFDADSMFLSTTSGTGSTPSLQTQLNPTTGDPAVQLFTFEFTDPISLVLDFDLLDMFEMLEVTTDGSAVYNHVGGAMPTSLAIENGLMLQGTSVGIGSDGAALGNVSLGQTRSVTLRYTSLTPNFTKFGAFSLGKVVPEPSAVSLLLLGFAGLCGLGRKTRA